jgi:hypothetical protein
MNIFFLAVTPSEIADMYCDQHVVKIILEICQMLYTAWYFSDEHHIVTERAPLNKSGKARGYRPAHKGHPMTMWVASSVENYIFAADLALALAEEYTARYGKTHACLAHAQWLRENLPSRFELRVSTKAYYAVEDIPEGLTPIPECMPEAYKMPSIVEAYQMYYMMDKMQFARFTPKSKKLYFDARPKDELIGELDDDSCPNLLVFKEGVEELELHGVGGHQRVQASQDI